MSIQVPPHTSTMDDKTRLPYCSNCKKIAKIPITCSKCFTKPRLEDKDHSTLSTYYCSFRCRDIHAEEHIPVCALFRLGGTLQVLWYAYREVMYDNHALNWRSSSDGKTTWILSNEDVHFDHMVDILKKFPIPGTLGDRDRKKALAYMMCDDSVAWMYDVTRYLLKDLNCHFEEIIVLTKGVKSHIIEIDSKGREDRNEDTEHILVKITIKNQSFALDLTSAQFGHFGSVIPWSHFKEERIDDYVQRDKSIGPRVYGKSKQEFVNDAKRCKNGFSKESVELRAGLNVRTYSAFMDGVGDWEDDNDMKWSEVLKKNKDDYEWIERELVWKVKERTKQAIVRVIAEREQYMEKLAGGEKRLKIKVQDIELSLKSLEV